MEQLNGVARLLSQVCNRNHTVSIGKRILTVLFQISNRAISSALSMALSVNAVFASENCVIRASVLGLQIQCYARLSSHISSIFFRMNKEFCLFEA